MDTEENQPETTLGMAQYARVLVRHWSVIALGALVGLLLAAGYLVMAPERVTATTEVAPQVITTDPFSPQRKASSDVLDQGREKAISRSVIVARDAAEKLPGTSVADVRSASSVELASDGGIAKISYTAATAAAARRGADAVANAYISYRATSAKARIKTLTGQLTSRINSLGKRLGDANYTIANNPGTSAKTARARGDRDRIQTELGGLYKSRNDLLGIDPTGGVVVVPAKDGPLASSPRPLPTLLTGVVAGSLLGIVGAFARHRFDRTLRTRADIEDALAQSSFATLRAANLAVPVTGQTAESLRVARERIADLLDAETPTLLLVDDSGDEAMRVAGGLATVVAETGRPVRLVATHPEAGRALAGLDEQIYPTLEVCTPDESTPRGELDARTRAALAQYPGTLVIAAMSSSDSRVTLLELLRHAGGVTPVLRVNVAKRDTVRWLRDRAAEMNTPVLGAVLVESQRRKLRRTSKEFAAKSQPRQEQTEPAPAEPTAAADQPAPAELQQVQHEHTEPARTPGSD